MPRPKREWYSFISNIYGEYYSVSYDVYGDPIVSKNTELTPLKYNPANLSGLQAEMATDKNYKSANRSVTYPFKLIKDGADICRYLDYMTNGSETLSFLTLIKYNPSRDVHELYYYGKLDFSKKKDDPKTGFTINTKDATAWGVLSERDNIQVQINCDSSNPKAIKVLFDGINLEEKYFFQPVADVLLHNLRTLDRRAYLSLPIVLVSSDGDSSGIITQDQPYWYFSGVSEDLAPFSAAQNLWFFQTKYDSHIQLKGSIDIDLTAETSGSFGLHFFYWTSSDLGNIWDSQYVGREYFFKSWEQNHFENNLHEEIQFNFTTELDLVANEWVGIFCLVDNLSNPGGNPTNYVNPYITFRTTPIVITTMTSVQPSTAWALRPLDLGQQIVEKVTNGLFTIDSNYYRVNNKVVCTTGDALRQEPIAFIKTSFQDWFKSYDAGDFLAIRLIDGNLWTEKWETVYAQDSTILELGEINEVEIIYNTDLLVNQILIGSPTQDYRHPSGRLEFNGTNKYSLEISSVKNELNLVSPYRRDGYGVEFVRLDYQQGSTKDSQGDSSVFMIAITDELGAATILKENFEIIQLDNFPLAPVITSPYNNDTITNRRPVIRGLAPAGSIVYIYVDTILDGSAVADANGRWGYDISTDLDEYQVSGITIIETGIHVINATFSNLTAQFSTVTVTIISGTTPVKFVYPINGDSLYDNFPTIKGIGQTGQVLPVIQNGITIGNAVVDGSCKWAFKMNGLVNGTNTISVGGVSITLSVNAFTAIPIITYIDHIQVASETYNQINNQPLIEGVGNPGATVNVYLDYYPNKPFGTTVVDLFGNWQIQTVPMLRSDGTLLTPIPNGEHTISTDLDIKNIQLSTNGYKLDKPSFTTITGVLDNSVFNIPLSPARMIRAWADYIASIMSQNRQGYLHFEQGDKNQALSTTINGVTITENANIELATFGKPLFYTQQATFKTVVPMTFNSAFRFFNHGGLIHATYYGQDLWFLPIGNMSVEDVTKDVQSWKLLISTKTPLTTLLNLYKEGITVTTMDNTIYHSDYNTLHFTKYNYALPSNYHQPEIYDDWHEFRNDRWFSKPLYVQKWQLSDGAIRDQIINTGLSAPELIMYRCFDGIEVTRTTYVASNPQPLRMPQICMEASIDITAFPQDEYFFVMSVGGISVLISERIETSDNWEKTIMWQCRNDSNLTGFCYSTGITSAIRIEGLVMKWQPQLEMVTSTDEIGDNVLLHSVASKKRKILIGSGAGLPDYLYLKASKFCMLDTFFVEGIRYVADKENKMQEQDRILGHPMYHYELDVQLKYNESGVMVSVNEVFVDTVVVTTDAEAFGIGGGGLIDVIAESEPE